MPYPAALEKFWIQRAVQATGGPEAEDTALRRLESKVQALSDLFTAGRPAKDFPDYFADRSLLAAYGVFFFPQSFAKAQWALDFAMRLRGWVPHSENIRILDLGAGAGPCGLALAFALRARFPACKVHLTALDHSPHALSALRDLAKEADLAGWLAVETVRHDLKSGVLPALGAPHHLVVAGFSLNEIFASRGHEQRTEFMRHLRPLLTGKGLLIALEPAFKATAEPLTRVSDALAGGPEFFRWGPQLSAAPCPFLAKGPGEKYWDHEVRAWQAPVSLEFVNRRLFRDIATLKFSCALLGASPPPPTAVPAGGVILRLVSRMVPIKGRFVCSAVTAAGELATLNLPTRGMSRKEEKAFEDRYERGDVIACQWTALKEPGLHKVERETITALLTAPARPDAPPAMP